MDNFWGSFRSFLVAVIFIVIGGGAFVYLNFFTKEPEPEVIDINPDTGISWNDLSDGMYVTFDANNIQGWKTYEMDDNGNDISRIYFVANYSQKTNSYSNFLSIYVKASDFDKFESLGNKVNSPNDYLKTITVKNYAYKLSPTEYNDFRNSIIFWGTYDVDEIEDLLLHYVIKPKAEVVDKYKLPKILSIVAIGIGALMLVGSVIGAIVNRY